MAFTPVTITSRGTGSAAKECRYNVSEFRSRSKKLTGRTLNFLLREDVAKKTGFKPGSPVSLYAGTKEDAGTVLIADTHPDVPRLWNKKGRSLQWTAPYVGDIAKTFPERQHLTGLTVLEATQGRLVVRLPKP